MKNEFLKYAALFLAGLLIGSALTYVLMNNNLSTSEDNLSGTFSSRAGGALSYSGDNWQINATAVLNSADINLIVSVRSAYEVEVKMRIDPQFYKITNSTCQGCALTPQANVYTGDVSFIAANEVVYKSMLNYKPGLYSPVEIVVVRDGEVVYQGTLNIK